MAQTSSSASPKSNARFWLLLAAGAVVGILGVVLLARYLSHRTVPPPEEKVAKAAAQTPTEAPRPIEIAGIRTFYDDKNRPQVRAVVINHSDEGFRATLTVALRPAEAARDAPPLARFTFQIPREIKPGDSLEIKAPLDAFGTLAALPPWQKIRADIE